MQNVTEPPLFLAASIFFAIKSARFERGITDPFEFWSPATVEKIRMACTDDFVEIVSETIGIHYNKLLIFHIRLKLMLTMLTDSGTLLYLNSNDLSKQLLLECV